MLILIILILIMLAFTLISDLALLNEFVKADVISIKNA